MTRSMEAYRSNFGDYPPCEGVLRNDGQWPMGDPVGWHLANAWPRAQWSGFQFSLDAKASTATLDPAESLVFWLGGMPLDTNVGDGRITWGGFRCEGFAVNGGRAPWRRSQSVAGEDTEPVRSGPFFNFDPYRLVDRDGDGFPEYVPPGDGPLLSRPPYVYLRHDAYGTAWWDALNPQFGQAVAYRDASRSWVKPKEYQIIAAGPDGSFGQGRLRILTTGEGCHAADRDNITNFSNLRSLDHLLP